MKYSKKQLKKAIKKYYKEMYENPDNFSDTSNNFKKDAKLTLKYLINIIDNTKK